MKKVLAALLLLMAIVEASFALPVYESAKPPVLVQGAMNSETDRLISAHDGDVALLYIYIRRTGIHDAEKAAAALCRTLGEIRAAEEKLMRMGLLDANAAPEGKPEELDTGSKKFLPPADELPQYTAREIASLAAQSHDFAELQAECAKKKGRQLSSAELGILAGIYDHLALPTGVIFLLLTYCQELAEARHPGSRISMRQLQKEAFRWANLELLTEEQAEEHIARQRERFSAVGR
ncbi:MAG: DnaD domain protein, partial [Synergistaceae bacterium]|nr:DnaD domain protein [Synergistaceae bacterium]